MAPRTSRTTAALLAVALTALSPALPAPALPPGSAAPPAPAAPGDAASGTAAAARTPSGRVPDVPWSAPATPAHPSSVLRAFDPPTSPWAAGHRGVDWALAGSDVLSPGDGTIRFAGPVAGRHVITVAHPDGLLSSLEPVELAAGLAVGDRVRAGDLLGTAQEEVEHCPGACVHWGVRVPEGWTVGGGTWDRYLDPLVLLGWSGPSVLWPVDGPPPGEAAPGGGPPAGVLREEAPR